MPTISLLNMKGGVSKTTLAVNIAWHLCRYGRKRVLLVDLDPQFNASQYIMHPDTWDQHRANPGTVADLLLEPRQPRMTARTKKKAARQSVNRLFYTVEENSRTGARLDLLPSDLTLARAIKNPEGVQHKLDKALGRISNTYDYVIIDCAPTDSVLTDTALMASDYVLIPMRPDRFSVLGYAMMQETLEEFRDTYPDPHNTQDLGVVFTQVSGETDIEQMCMDEIEEQAEYVFQASIPRSVRSYTKSVLTRRPIFDTSYAHRPTKQALTQVVHEMKSRIEALEQEEQN